jgi:phosphate acetyltransferase
MIKSIVSKVMSNKKNILLHEFHDPRIIKAMTGVIQDDVADISLLGEQSEIFNKINNVDNGIVNYILSNINIINPKSPDVKSIIDNDAMIKCDGYTYPEYSNIDVGHILLKNGVVDGMVSGATMPTGNVIKSALKHVGLKEGMSTLSSFFLMEKYDNNPLLFADCAVVVSPTAKQLVDISLSTRESYKLFFGKEPKIALLSHSTMGSSKGREVHKIMEAVSIIKNFDKKILVDGELQLDAALIPEVAKIKSPHSIIKGDADILIFPSLDAGNIGYKLAERLGNYTATGPVFQGLNRQTNDLSRGCSVEDIYNMIAITSL